MVINIDIDNTVNNFLDCFIEQFNSVTGRSLTHEDITSYWLNKCTGVSSDTLSTLFFKNNTFHSTFKPLPYAQEAINQLVDSGHTVRFVTAINYEVIQARLDFVRTYFPFLEPSKHLIVTEHKEFIYADVVIDDSVDNLKNVNSKCEFILFAQPWNTMWRQTYITFDNWHDLLSYLLSIKQ